MSCRFSTVLASVPHGFAFVFGIAHTVRVFHLSFAFAYAKNAKTQAELFSWWLLFFHTVRAFDFSFASVLAFPTSLGSVLLDFACVSVFFYIEKGLHPSVVFWCYLVS